MTRSERPKSGKSDADGRITRREWIGTASSAAAVLSSWSGASPSFANESSQLGDDITASSATAMARAVAGKEISSEELTRACLDRIQTVNPKINAVVQLTADAALAAARAADEALARGDDVGPLHGVPMTIKDSLDTRGVVSTAGTMGRAHFVPNEDATVVRRLREAGAILMGKTNTPELTFAGDTDNLVYGRTNNPYDVERSPGGSSGGAAAIVAAAGSPFDIGSDTGGSVRIPAHCNGVAGLKPTSGRVPRTGHIVGFDDVMESVTTLGPIARRVEDLATLLPIIAGPDGRDPGVVPAELRGADDVDIGSLRVAFYTDNGEVSATAETVSTVENAARSLGDTGARVTERRPDPMPETSELMLSLILADGGAGIRRRLERHGTEDVHPWLAPFTAAGPGESAETAYLNIERWARYRREMLAFMADYDVVLCPVVATPAPLHLKRGEERSFGAWYTPGYNLTGWPVAVVRCGTSPEGLPIGVQAVAPPWREDIALAVAAHLERELGGYQAPSIA